MGFFRQKYWSGLPCPPPGDLPDPGIELMSPALQADSLPSEPPGKPWVLVVCVCVCVCVCMCVCGSVISRQEYWSGLPFPSPGDLPDPGIELMSPALQADSLPPEPPVKPFYAINLHIN